MKNVWLSDEDIAFLFELQFNLESTANVTFDEDFSEEAERLQMIIDKIKG